MEYPQTTYNVQPLYRRGGKGEPPCLSLNQLVGLPSVYAGRWYDVDYSFSGGRVVERLAFERMVIVERSQSRVRRI